MTEAELIRALNDPEEFKRLIKDGLDLRKAAEHFPRYADTLINIVLNDPEEFKRLIREPYHLRMAPEDFPRYADTIINIVLNDPEEFKRLIKGWYDLQMAAEHFPRYADTLINIVLNDPEEFKRLIKSRYDLRMAAEDFPRYADTLINIVLNDPEEFKRLIRDQYDLRMAAEHFPRYADTLNQRFSEIGSQPAKDSQVKSSPVKQPNSDEVEKMAKKKSKEIRAILYFERQFSTRTYSDQPSSAIEPSRLLAGLPAFINESESYQAGRKILIFPVSIFDGDEWDEYKQHAAALRMALLSQSGFRLYFYNDKNLTLFSGKAFSFIEEIKEESKKQKLLELLEDLQQELQDIPQELQKIKERQKLHLQKLDTLNNAPDELEEILKNHPADQIEVLDEKSLNILIGGDESDLDIFFPFNKITLDDTTLPLMSAENFTKLMRNHGHQIESLIISAGIGITGKTITQEMANELEKLTKLTLKGRLPVDGFVAPLLLPLSQVTTLLLDKCLFDMTCLASVDFAELTSLHVNRCYMTAETLNAILKKAPNLKELVITSCQYLNTSDLSDLNLEKLEKVSIINNNISEKSIQEIIKRVANQDDKKIIIHRISEKIKTKRKEIPAQKIDQGSFLEAVKKIPSGNMIQEKIKDNSVSVKLVDADTTPDESETFTVERRFIGKPKSPGIRDIRLNRFNRLSFNGGDVKTPFVLSDDRKLTLVNIENLKESDLPLYDEFQKQGNGHYFGRFEMHLTSEWKAIPSISSNETLKSFYHSPMTEVEIKKSTEDGFHYIRLKANEIKKPLSVMIETLLFCSSLSAALYNTLPTEIKNLVRNCRGFRHETLDKKLYPSAKNYLDQIISQRVGACRHRSVAFMQLMKDQFPHIPVQIINNDVHSYVEVYHEGVWVACDLGGYPAHVNINRTNLSEGSNDDNRTPDLESPETTYQLTLSSRGEPLTVKYIKGLKNLTTLKLDNIDQFPDELGTSHLDTLELSGCRLTAKELTRILNKTPELKTIKLMHCAMSPDEFRKIDFSILTQLEHVTMIGDFVPDITALKTVMSTCLKAKWVIQSDHLEKDKTVESISELPGQFVLKESKIEIPITRYFPDPAKVDAFSIVNAEWKSGLISCADTQNVRILLEKQCKATQKPCFYVNSPNELQCAKPYIVRDSLTNVGVIKPGPGGALYDFIQQHPDATLIINYDNFKASDIARFNSMLDEERLIDGVPAPKQCKIIGLINPNQIGAYLGADFYSRFEFQHEFNGLLVDSNSMVVDNAVSGLAPVTYLIQLNGGGDWQTRLLGGWRLDGHQLIFEEGRLLNAIKQGFVHIVLNNPPVNNHEFERFITDIDIHQGIFHQGRFSMPVPNNFRLTMAQSLSFPDKDHYFSFNQHPTLDENVSILNHATLSSFLGRYECHEKDKNLFLKPGYIQQHADNTLNVYVTKTLNPEAWLTLLECARIYHVKLDISLAPSVNLPDELNPGRSVSDVKVDHRDHTALFVSHYPWLIEYPPDAMVIDISELEPSDLLTAVKSEFDEKRFSYYFTKKASFLEQALSENKKIILKGKWSNRLSQALEPLIYQRLTSPRCAGQLRLICDNESTFPWMTKSPAMLDLAPLTVPIILNATFDQRLQLVSQVLEKQPFVYLAGATGVGKTQFIETIWKEHHPACHYGADKMEEWITDQRPGLKTLFIDEANITSRQWSELEGLYNKQPSIYYRGEYYLLTPDHKVIFAGNPLSYGGERQRPAFFEHHQGEINFQPIPSNVIVKQLGLDEKTAKPILAVYDYISHLNPNDTLITPREIIMMARLTQAAMTMHPGQMVPEDIATYFAHTLSQRYVPPDKKAAFDNQFKLQATPRIVHLNLHSFIVNQTNQPAVDALIHQLNLRELRLSGDPAVPEKGGLGGLILEGDAGIGKSVLVSEVLAAKDFKEKQDFYKLPASLSGHEKEKLLLTAFHEGKIVIIDEINSSPMLERMLNALLEGHDLHGNPPKKSGFMLIGTQNPIKFKGRIQTTLPLQHRLQTVVMSPYSQKEEREILRHIGLPHRIRETMIAEFEQHKQSNSKLCFRDLLKYAKKWVKQHAHKKPPNMDVMPLPQVGQICKLVSIENVEVYYAKKFGFDAMPLRANKTGNISIRYLAKRNHSLQGEILEFSMWQKNLTDMGYKSEVIDFKDDINLFEKSIQDSLERGDLPMLAFSVNMETGHPDPKPREPADREHAAVIMGYDSHTDKVTIVHWGKTYTVDLVALYHSSQALLPTRSPEYYNKNTAYAPEHRDYRPKYLSAKDKGERSSITPSINSGFQSKLLIVKRPDTSYLLGARKALRVGEAFRQEQFFSQNPNGNMNGGTPNKKRKRP